MNKNYTLYVHVNKINGKRYVGITRQEPKYRWRSDGSGYIRSPFFYQAIKKYGWDNFEHNILFTNLSREQAIELEKQYIKLWNTRNKKYGYNMTDGGDGTVNIEISQERREQISRFHKGRKRSEETRLKLSKALKGKKPTQETIEKLSLSHLGHKSTENQLKALQKGWYSGRKEVYCVDDFGNKMEFDSISSASKHFNNTRLSKSFKRIATNHEKCCNRYWYYKESA